MFGKNPYILPLVALLVLGMLYYFQSRQRELANVFQTGGGTTVIDDTTLTGPKAATWTCSDSDRKGSVYAFDVSAVSGELTAELKTSQLLLNGPLLIWLPESADVCRHLDLGQGGVFRLDLSADQRELTVRSDLASGPDLTFSLPESPRIRVVLEWNTEAAVLFVDGVKKGTLSLSSPVPEGHYRLYAEQANDKKSGVESLKLRLIRGRSIN